MSSILPLDHDDDDAAALWRERAVSDVAAIAVLLDVLEAAQDRLRRSPYDPGFRQSVEDARGDLLGYVTRLAELARAPRPG